MSTLTVPFFADASIPGGYFTAAGGWSVNGTTDHGTAVVALSDGLTVSTASGAAAAVHYFYPSSVTGATIPVGAVINSVTVHTHLKIGSAGSSYVGIRFTDSGGLTDVIKAWDQNQFNTFYSNITETATTEYTRLCSTNPTTGLAWTRSNIFTTEFGLDVSGGGSFQTVTVDKHYIVVDYSVSWWSLLLPFVTLYTISASLPSAYTLPFDYFSNGTFYPAGTTFAWASASAPTDKGWWMSTGDAFAGAAYVVDNTDRPKAPRGFTEVTAFATGSTSFYGGFPGVASGFNNHLVYAPGGYTVGTDSPTLRIYDGQFDRPIATVPNTSAGTVPKAVMTTLTANGVVYIATLDTGSNSTNWVGRVFSLDIESGQMTPVGLPLATGHVPYALCWHAGMLWCGTHRQSSAASGKIFRIRPGIDTDWTADYDLSTSTVANCASLASYGGKLYVGTTNAAAAFAKVLVRDTAGAYTTSTTASGGTATANNGFPSMAVFGTNLYTGYYNADTPAVSKIYKYDGSSWSTAYTGSGTTIVPFLALFSDLSNLFAIGGGVGVNAVLLKTADGSSWTDESAFLSQGSPASTGLPAFGVVVH